MVRSTPVPPVSGDTVIVPAGNKLPLLVDTVTVNVAPTSMSVGDTVTTMLSPSSNTAEGSVIAVNTGVSFVLDTVTVKLWSTFTVPSLTRNTTE